MAYHNVTNSKSALWDRDPVVVKEVPVVEPTPPLPEVTEGQGFPLGIDGIGGE